MQIPGKYALITGSSRGIGELLQKSNAVNLLCSEEAGSITGQIISADGGASLMNAALPLELQQLVTRRAAASLLC